MHQKVLTTYGVKLCGKKCIIFRDSPKKDGYSLQRKVFLFRIVLTIICSWYSSLNQVPVVIRSVLNRISATSAKQTQETGSTSSFRCQFNGWWMGKSEPYISKAIMQRIPNTVGFSVNYEKPAGIEGQTANDKYQEI